MLKRPVRHDSHTSLSSFEDKTHCYITSVGKDCSSTFAKSLSCKSVTGLSVWSLIVLPPTVSMADISSYT